MFETIQKNGELITKEEVETFTISDFTGTFDQVISRLQEEKTRLEHKFSKNLILEKAWSRDYEVEIIAVIHERKANKQETENWNKQEAQRKAYRQAEYERLKKEFS